jgi:adenine deaminase
MCLCTDDRNPLDIAEEGHLDHMIRRLIALGSPPLAVYRAASLSAAEAFGLKDRGLIAPGKRADIVALDSLASCKAQYVWAGGRLVSDAAFAARGAPLRPWGRNSVTAPPRQPRRFRAPANREETDVIGIIEGKIITEHLHETIPIVDGDKHPDTVARPAAHRGDRAARQERQYRHGLRAGLRHDGGRHRHDGQPRPPQHRLRRRRLRGHGRWPPPVLGEIEGGFVVARDGEVLAELALPVAGLMSLGSFEDVRARSGGSARRRCVPGRRPARAVPAAGFPGLPVIPALKITDRGMVDVTKFEIIG